MERLVALHYDKDSGAFRDYGLHTEAVRLTWTTVPVPEGQQPQVDDGSKGFRVQGLPVQEPTRAVKLQAMVSGSKAVLHQSGVQNCAVCCHRNNVPTAVQRCVTAAGSAPTVVQPQPHHRMCACMNAFSRLQKSLAALLLP